jgi:hypothetical protein
MYCENIPKIDISGKNNTLTSMLSNFYIDPESYRIS